MHEESNLWLLVESPFATLPNEKFKVDSQSCLKTMNDELAAWEPSSFLGPYQTDLQPCAALQTELCKQSSYPGLIVQSICKTFLSWGPHQGLSSVPLHKTSVAQTDEANVSHWEQ